MAGGPTDDDGWGEAADEQGPPKRPTIVGWDDDDELEAPVEATPQPQPEPEPEPEPEPQPEPEPAVVVSGELESETEPETPAPELTVAPEPEARAASDAQGWSGSLAEAAGIDVPPPPEPREPLLSRRGWFVALIVLALALLLSAGGVLSHLNSSRLYLVCGDDDVRAERGRWFPWGRTTLDGDRWKPFKLPGVCESRELDSESELEGAFLDLLVTRASTLLAAEAPDLDEAEGLIEQGLALARAPEHKPERTELERLRGDVEYWRGRADITGALERLRSAREHYDEAVKIGPRHAGDADQWVSFIDGVLERIGAGPGEIEPEPSTSTAPGPTEPARPFTDAAPPATPVVIPDAGPTPGPEPDAGVPRGGVLL